MSAEVVGLHAYCFCVTHSLQPLGAWPKEPLLLIFQRLLVFPPHSSIRSLFASEVWSSRCDLRICCWLQEYLDISSPPLEVSAYVAPHVQDVIVHKIPRHAQRISPQGSKHIQEYKNNSSRPLMSHQRRTSITFDIPSKEAYNMPEDPKGKAKRVATDNGMYVVTQKTVIHTCACVYLWDTQ